jgi:hypothetical protein
MGTSSSLSRAWLAAEPLGADAPGDEVDRLQRQCVASAAGSVMVGRHASTLRLAASTTEAPGGQLVLDCSSLAALARWRVAVVEVVSNGCGYGCVHE